MKFSPFGLTIALSALTVAATPVALAPRATPTVYLCGDSTMANKGANDGATDGWGQYFGALSTVTVVNKAIGGRSARSYYNEGRFTAVTNLLSAGDIVVIEFGHNDGGSPESNDNGRSDCPGAGTETCISDATGETVYTFVFYVIQAAKAMIAKGATVVLSSQTPNNLWETGTFAGGAGPRFVGYQKTAATALGTGASFVDHYQATANMYRKLGNSATNALYPNDHTHTSPAGANLVAQAFAQAIAAKFNGTTSLVNYIKSPAPSVY
ncbi:SGNH hydrolase-type esterase domain-containing protein [Bisporella sp. PMI_857]|nr:SGNH hydrolase-type esterase domain-containing protein [Bisporella sp. PMI_857]